MADIIEIIIRAQDFASQKLDRVINRLQALDRQGGVTARSAERLNKAFTPDQIERHAKALEAESERLGGVERQARLTRQELEKLGQVPLRFGNSRTPAAFTDQPGPGVISGQRTQGGKFFPNVQRQVEDVDSLTGGFERLGGAVEHDKNQLSLLEQPLERLRTTPQLTALNRALTDARGRSAQLGNEIQGIDRLSRLLGSRRADLLGLAGQRQKLEDTKKGVDNLGDSLLRLRDANKGELNLAEFERARRLIPELGKEYDRLRLDLTRLDDEQAASANAQSRLSFATRAQRREFDQASTRIANMRARLSEVRDEIGALDRLRGDKSVEEFSRQFPDLALSMRAAKDEAQGLQRGIRGLEGALLRLERARLPGIGSKFRKEFALADNDIDNFLKNTKRLDLGLGDSGSGFRQLGRGAGDAENSIGRAAQALDDFSKIDETLALGLKRLFSFFFAIASILPALESLLGAVLAAVVALAGGVTALVGALGTLAGLLGTLPGLLAGFAGAAAAALGIFGPALNKITGRLQEIQRARDTARRAAPGQAQKEDTQVADLERQVRRQIRSNTEGLKDAERDYHALVVRNREQERDLDLDIARQKIRNVERLRDAEQRLANIRKQNESTERQLAQDVTNARAELLGLQAEGASPESVAAAQGRLDQAQHAQTLQRVSSQAQEEKRAQDDLQRVKRQNAQDLSDLETRRHRLVRDNAEQERTAEVRIFRLKRDNAERLQDLQRQLTRARAQADIQALKGANALKSALQGLDPVQRRIVLKILAIKAEWNKLTAATRLRGERLAERALSFLQNNLPQITRTVNGFGNEMLTAGEKLARAFTTPDHLKTLNGIFADGQGLIHDFGQALVNLVDPLLRVAEAARPLTRHLGEITESITASINKRVREASVVPVTAREAHGHGAGAAGVTDAPRAQQSELQRFFGSTRRVVDLLGKALGKLADALLHVLVIAEPFGEKILRDFGKWADRVDRFTKSASGKRSIKSFFADATPAFEDFIKTAGAVVKSLFNIGRALIKPGSGPGGRSALGNLLKSIRDGLPEFEKSVIRATTHTLPNLIKFFGQLFKLLDSLTQPGGPFNTLLSMLSTLIGLFNALGPLRAPVLSLISAIFIAPAVVKGWRNLKILMEETIGTLKFFSTFSRAAFQAFTKGKLLDFLGNTTPILRVRLAWMKFMDFANLSVTRFQTAWAAATRNIGGRLRSLFARFAGEQGGGNIAQRIAAPFVNGLNLARGQVTRFRAFMRIQFAQIALLVRGSRIGTAFASVASAISGVLGRLVLAFRAFRLASIAAFLTNPITIAVIAIIAVIILLDRKFHFLRPTIEFIGKLLKEAPEAAAKAWGKFKDFVVGVVTTVVNFVKRHWKLLLAVMLGPFSLFIAGVIKFRHQIFGFISGLVSGIIGFFARLPGRVANIAVRVGNLFVDGVKGILGFFRDLPGKILHALEGLPGKVVGIARQIGRLFAAVLKAPINAVISLINSIKIPGLHIHVGKKVFGKFVGVDFTTPDIDPFPHIPHLARGGIVPGVPPMRHDKDNVLAMLRSREWVLSDAQKSRASRLTGMSVSALQRALFTSAELRPRRSFALGGVVAPEDLTAAANVTTVHAPISVQTASTTADAEYIARALETRLGRW